MNMASTSRFMKKLKLRLHRKLLQEVSKRNSWKSIMIALAGTARLGNILSP